MKPDFDSYDRVLVAFSGGKDSVASLLALIEAGVALNRIELHHHDVDGGAGVFMDWPCTTDYCRAFAREFGLPLYLSYKDGGFEREMDRRQSPTAPIIFETPAGVRPPGGKGPAGTRRRLGRAAGGAGG